MKNKAVFIFLILGFVGFISTPLFAAGNELGLDSKLNYDIYLSGQDTNPTIIRNVQIVSLREVANKTFVVIYTDDFAGKRSEGLVALDSIQAIIPNFRISTSTGTIQIQKR